ncbi:MAG: hypothetical protein ABL929_11155 [Ferruginibacter sp.]
MKFKKSIYYFIFSLIFLISINSCKKFEASQFSNEPLFINSEDKFFNSHRTNDSKENAIVNYVKKINEKENFVNNAIKQIGFPRWNKMVSTFIKTNPNSFASSEDSSNTYYIPFVRDSQNFVNATLVISTTNTDTLFRFKYDWQYAQMQNSPNSVLDSAENFAIFFMKLIKQFLDTKNLK